MNALQTGLRTAELNGFFALAGGTLPARLFRRTFFSDLAQLMSADGVLVLNYFGRVDANLRAAACALQAAGFKHLRLFQEAAQAGALSLCRQPKIANHEPLWLPVIIHTLAYSM